MNAADTAIILAGGLGTRLRSVIADLPKPMAPVNGKPFLHYLFQYLTKHNIARVVLSVGYKSTAIESFFGNKYLGIDMVYSQEQEPLGTGGGIKKAFEIAGDSAFVLNGDTFFDISLSELKLFASLHQAEIALALKPMKDFDRYGTVELNGSCITSFSEKRYCCDGRINGGIYFMNKSVFSEVKDTVFSFEKDVLEKQVKGGKIYGKEFENYFIDIGVPEDYDRAQTDFKKLF